MDYADFYILFDKGTRGAYHAMGESLINSVAYFKGEMPEGEHLSFGHRILGKTIYDLVGIGYVSPYLLSGKVIRLLMENNVTGWKTYPCILYDKFGKIIDGYSLFSVTGKCGVIDNSKSEILLKQYPSGAFGKVRKGLYFHLDTLDGSDIFSPDGTTFTLVTDRVRKLLLKNRVTNISFICITDLERIIVEEPTLEMQAKYRDVAADFFSEH
jgi:hypothetical protein